MTNCILVENIFRENDPGNPDLRPGNLI